MAEIVRRVDEERHQLSRVEWADRMAPQLDDGPGSREVSIRIRR